MKIKIALLSATAVLVSCTTVSDSNRSVNVEDWEPRAISQKASYVTDAAPDQAAAICETREMRKKVIDDIDTNDAVRVMIVEDGATGSRVLSEVEIDCRDYFLRKSLAPEPAPAPAQIVRASAPRVERVETKTLSTRTESQNLTYIVQKGDTVWGIARQHCTTAKAVSRLNGLGRGNVIDIGQRLRLPDEECE